MSYSLEEKIQYLAIYSRLGIICLQFFGNLILPDHDAGVFKKPLDNNNNVTDAPIDALVNFALGGLTRWDAQYFLHIAHYGYTYENTLAFFPLFPLFTRQLSYFLLFAMNSLLKPFFQTEIIMSDHAALVLVSVTLNNIVFVKTAKIIFTLSNIVLKNEKIAFISAVLFCINPASIFFSAAYSESVFCFLTFLGLLQLERRNYFMNYIIIGMTGGVRSNGLINLCFLAYKYLKGKFNSKISFLFDSSFFFGILVSSLPFLFFQFYCYLKYCFPVEVNLPDFIYNYGVSNNFVFPGNGSLWCREFIPMAYAYVQKHYWNVGFLNYYELKQIPNFLLATPMVYIVARGSFDFVKRHKLLLLRLGFYEEKNGGGGTGLPLSAFPYVVHGFFLLVFALFIMHIQVTTRLLASSSPLPYWYCAQALSSYVKESHEGNVLEKLRKKRKQREYYYHCCHWESVENKKSKWKTFLWTESFRGYAFFIKWYFLSYFFIGTVLFSNHLPWT